MPQYRVVLVFEGARTHAVRSRLEKALGVDKDVLQQVSLIGKASSRSARLAAVQERVEDAKSDVEALKDEMQNWHDSLPEAMQSGEQGDKIEEAITALTDIEDGLDSITWEVEFPGMYGK